MAVGCRALQGAALLPTCPLPDAEVTHRFSHLSLRRAEQSTALRAQLFLELACQGCGGGPGWRAGMGRVTRSGLIRIEWGPRSCSGWHSGAGRIDERVSSDLQPQALCLAVFSLSLPTQSPRDLSRLGSCFTTPAGSRQGVLTTLWFQLLVS